MVSRMPMGVPNRRMNGNVAERKNVCGFAR
jgi:hypothetical protein